MVFKWISPIFLNLTDTLQIVKNRKFTGKRLFVRLKPLDPISLRSTPTNFKSQNNREINNAFWSWALKCLCKFCICRFIVTLQKHYTNQLHGMNRLLGTSLLLLVCMQIKKGSMRPSLIMILNIGYSSSCTTRPERSLGSNHVVFGGMMLPESAILINCCIETG